MIIMLVFLVACLIFTGVTIRTLINFSVGDPLSEYISHDNLVAMIYDLVYFYSAVQFIYLGLTLVMLLYLIMIFKNLRSEVSPTERKEAKKHEAEQKKKEEEERKKRKEKKKKKEGNETEEKDKKSDDQASELKEWKHLYRETNRS
jgi:flagellar biosynthesis/type III secretory pathway M-ring protein FliF/YscJ